MFSDPFVHITSFCINVKGVENVQLCRRICYAVGDRYPRLVALDGTYLGSFYEHDNCVEISFFRAEDVDTALETLAFIGFSGQYLIYEDRFFTRSHPGSILIAEGTL